MLAGKSCCPERVACRRGRPALPCYLQASPRRLHSSALRAQQQEEPVGAPSSVLVQQAAAAEHSSRGGPGADLSSAQGAWLPQVQWWRWRWGSNIRYYRAGSAGPPLLLVHGFGVGAWHWEYNLEELSRSYQVFAVELMGQGSSWPSASSMSSQSSMDEADLAAAQQDLLGPSADLDNPASHGPLYFSIATWTQQLTHFVQQVIGGPAYVAGNSLGGFLAVSLAHQQPQLVRGLVLLNSTPFWSMRPAPDQPQGLWGMLGFDGAVPVPPALKRTIEVLWWDKLRDPRMVQDMLSLVYAHKAAASSAELVERIIDATQQPGALDAFASIVLSPRSPVDFDAMLCELRCPVSLVYGRQDPWVVPMWGQRAAFQLQQAGKPVAMYLELLEAGHCPHHEAPAATNTAIDMCLAHMEELHATQQQQPQQQQQGATVTSAATSGEAATGRRAGKPVPPLAVGQRVRVQERCGREVTIEHVDGQPRQVFEYGARLMLLASAALAQGKRMSPNTPASHMRTKDA